MWDTRCPRTIRGWPFVAKQRTNKRLPATIHRDNVETYARWPAKLIFVPSGGRQTSIYAAGFQSQPPHDQPQTLTLTLNTQLLVAAWLWCALERSYVVHSHKLACRHAGKMCLGWPIFSDTLTPDPLLAELVLSKASPGGPCAPLRTGDVPLTVSPRSRLTAAVIDRISTCTTPIPTRRPGYGP